MLRPGMGENAHSHRYAAKSLDGIEPGRSIGRISQWCWKAAVAHVVVVEQKKEGAGRFSLPNGRGDRSPDTRRVLASSIR